jgi:hypothetical protein
VRFAFRFQLKELAALVLQGKQTGSGTTGIDANPPVVTQWVGKLQKVLTATRAVGPVSLSLAEWLKIGGQLATNSVQQVV